MAKYALQERLVIIQKFYENRRSFVNTYRALRENFGVNNRPPLLAIRRIVEKFENNFTLHDVKTPRRHRNARTVENIAAVRASVAVDPNLSIPRRAQELRIKQTTTWRILKEDLNLHPYKIVLTQELKPLDHRRRRAFSAWSLEQLETDPNFAKKIIFSDEAPFWLSGYLNKQNCRFWCENNPQQIYEKPLYPLKVTVWCGLWYGGIIGPFFFQNEAGDAVTVNGERYRQMLRHFLWPNLDALDLEDMWFQQDGATCHTAHETIDILQEKFDERIISRNAAVHWPPRSCDLTPLDYFLWGYLKSKVYENRPQTLDALRLNIEHCIRQNTPDLLHKVIENWVRRIRSCTRSRGGHLNDVFFKT